MVERLEAHFTEVRGMTPYYADDLVTIYHGDSLEILPYAPKFDSVDELLAWLARGEAMTEQEVPQGSPVPPPDEPVTVPDLTEPEDEGEVDNGLDTEHQDQQTG